MRLPFRQSSRDPMAPTSLEQANGTDARTPDPVFPSLSDDFGAVQVFPYGKGRGVIRPDERPMGASRPAVAASWQELEDLADEPEIQEVIRGGIRRGVIRVTAKSQGGIRFLVRSPG